MASYTSLFSRFLVPLAAFCLLPIGGLLATTTTQSDDSTTLTVDPRSIPDDAPPPMSAFEIDSSYVGDSDFREKRFDGAGAGRAVDFAGIDEAANAVEIDRRVHLFDRIYLKLGMKFERFDFSTTTAPIPSTLQTLHGIIGLEYVVKGEPAVSLYVNPGLYLAHFSQINLGSIDVPVDIATGVPVPFFHNVYGIVGMHISALARDPVFPILGVVWLINNHLSIQAVPPEPRAVYKLNNHFDMFVGGELLGEAYKTDYRRGLRPQDQRFNGAVLDYSESRVGGGTTYNFNKALNIDLGGGCTLQRDFDYYRPDASKRFITHPAPYAKVEISAEF